MHVAATFHLQKLEVNGEPVKLKIWDTAGQERFSSLLPMYYKGCNGAFIVYDMTSAVSYLPLRTMFLIYKQPGVLKNKLIGKKSIIQETIH